MLSTSNRTSVLVRVAALSVLALSLACGRAKNTPEQALESLRSAVAQQKWDLLYDILPDDEQKKWHANVEDILLSNQQGREQADDLKKMGFAVPKPSDMLAEMKITPEQWGALSQREKFARVFGLNAKINLGEVGVNPDNLMNSTVRRSTISGDRAEVIIDDGKGHNTKLIFKLQGEYWRFQLSGDEK